MSIQADKDLNLSLVLPVLLCDCETWTLNSDLVRRVDVFGTKCLQRVVGYCWNDLGLNQRLFHETESRFVTILVCEHQLRLCGHMAQFPDVDNVYRVVFVRDNPEQRTPRGRPHNSWLGQVVRSLRMGRVVMWRPPWGDWLGLSQSK